MKTEPPVEALVAWCKTRDIALCVLFGSRARGQARPDSDYDLALKPGRPLAPLDRIAWQVEIENLFGCKCQPSAANANDRSGARVGDCARRKTSVRARSRVVDG